MFGQNIIITERVGALRQLGRNALRGKWASAILSVVLFILCLQVPVIVFNKLFGYNMSNFMTMIMGPENPYVLNPDQYAAMYGYTPSISLLSMVYILAVSGAFTLGICLFYLASFRGHDVGPKDIFLGFERFGKALGLFLFMHLFVFLWTMLFVIPGIIAAIRYSQAFFVLSDDPEKSITECMNESKMMMKGNKAKYFVLNLSFIGWMILSEIPGAIISGIAQTVTTNQVAIACASLVGTLFMAPIIAYMFSTFAGFYEILAGHLIKETAPAPVTADQIDVEAPVETIEEVIEIVEENDPVQKQADVQDLLEDSAENQNTEEKE